MDKAKLEFKNLSADDLAELEDRIADEVEQARADRNLALFI